MDSAEIALRADCKSARFMIGVIESRWGVVEGSQLSPDISWPSVIFWVAAHGNPNIKVYFKFDCSNYPVDPVTGTVWDMDTNSQSCAGKLPKLTERGKQIVRFDWEGGRALYHPYDRIASNSHPQWKSSLPHLIWDRDHCIVDFLEELEAVLN